jgi:hypothetical protein
MKKLLFLLTISLLSFVNCPTSLNAQTIPPPFINYQAVLYDVNGANPNNPLTNQSFSTFVNINDELGNLLYREEHYASTDANGLITVKMGDGLYTAGPITNFNQINWGVGKYYLVVDFDINGTISSTAPEQLVTVPYSFYAGKAGNGMTSVADNGNGTLTFTYANGATYTTPTLTGIQGAVGPAGTNGTNGLNALIKTTTEPAGVNCANGGTKIETGLDANSNSVLDAVEVNVGQTTFVCGSQTSSGIGLGFSNMQVFSNSGIFSWTVPAGVNKVMIEVWGAGGGGSFNISCRGGGGGGYGKSILNVIPGDIYSVTVGTGGSAGSSSTLPNGLAGGNSSFGSLLISNGGQGGSTSVNMYLSGLGGSSNGIINQTGGKGVDGDCRGGDGALGGAGGVNNSTCTGGVQNGNVPGGGGAGGTGSSCSQGSGAKGRVIIWY